MSVSIVIPVYNVKPYLNRCLKSILQQTYHDLEVILVDDGSTDGSSSICDDFQKKNPGVIVIHQENAGLSAARNAGMERASGEYITFLDSDDYLSVDFIEKAVKLCEDTESDIAILRMLYIPEGMNDEVPDDAKVTSKVMTSQEAIEASLYQKNYSCCIPGKVFKRKLFESIRFPVGRLSEDLATCHLLFDLSKKSIYTSTIGYYYRQHTTSIMHTFHPERMDALVWANEIEEFCRNKYPEIIAACISRKFNVAVHLLLELPEEDRRYSEYYKILWSTIRDTRMRVILSGQTRFREKCAAILSFSGVGMMKKIWNSKLAIKKTNIDEK